LEAYGRVLGLLETNKFGRWRVPLRGLKTEDKSTAFIDDPKVSRDQEYWEQHTARNKGGPATV